LALISGGKGIFMFLAVLLLWERILELKKKVENLLDEANTRREGETSPST
jgi:hypothetical protein